MNLLHSLKLSLSNLCKNSSLSFDFLKSSKPVVSKMVITPVQDPDSFSFNEKRKVLISHVQGLSDKLFKEHPDKLESSLLKLNKSMSDFIVYKTRTQLSTPRY